MDRTENTIPFLIWQLDIIIRFMEGLHLLPFFPFSPS